MFFKSPDERKLLMIPGVRETKMVYGGYYVSIVHTDGKTYTWIFVGYREIDDAWKLVKEVRISV